MTVIAAARDAGRSADEVGLAAGRSKRAVHDAILAHHPALSFTLIGDAVAYVLGSE